jgi:hypothetical protein
MMDHISVQGQGGTFNAYIARPKILPTSAVVLLQELVGANADIRSRDGYSQGDRATHIQDDSSGHWKSSHHERNGEACSGRRLVRPRTVLVDERADGVHISYDRMASLLTSYGDRDALNIARDLDAKIEDVLRQAAA